MEDMSYGMIFLWKDMFNRNLSHGRTFLAGGHVLCEVMSYWRTCLPGGLSYGSTCFTGGQRISYFQLLPQCRCTIFCHSQSCLE